MSFDDFLMDFRGVQEVRGYGMVVVNRLFRGRGKPIRRGEQGYIPKDIGYRMTDD